MRVVILGAGPAGLYLGYLLKRRSPETDIRIFEQNPAGATFGFGVVFSDRALEFLNDDDPETLKAIAPHMQSWRADRHRRGGLCRGGAPTVVAAPAGAGALSGNRARLRARRERARRFRWSRSRRRRRRRELAGAPPARARIRGDGHAARQSFRLVRH